MRNGFVFGNKGTWDFDILVEHYPAQKGPARKRTTVSVLGRNGNLHIDEGTFENYQQPYEIGFHGKKSTPEQSHEIKEWLMSSGTYLRLEDTYDPDYFRLATFGGPLDIENKLNKMGKCVVYFDCAPQSFLKTGQYPIAFKTPSSLHNPTAEIAKPVITIRGSGSGTVTVGDVTVEVKQIQDQITLDCETQNAYRQVGDGAPENMNSCIYAPLFPELVPGVNAISWTGDITGVDIIPRWWTL